MQGQREYLNHDSLKTLVECYSLVTVLSSVLGRFGNDLNVEIASLSSSGVAMKKESN